MLNKTGPRLLAHLLLMLSGSLLLTLLVLPTNKALWMNHTVILTNLLPHSDGDAGALQHMWPCL